MRIRIQIQVRNPENGLFFSRIQICKINVDPDPKPQIHKKMRISADPDPALQPCLGGSSNNAGISKSQPNQFVAKVCLQIPPVYQFKSTHVSLV